MFKALSYVVMTLTKGLFGVSLIDPIEVFYLPANRIVFPILSKSGNSSVKLKIIKVFNPGFEAAFPGIHQIDPATVTRGEVQRLFFYTKKEYSRFCFEKEVRLVIRSPYDRYYSYYLGVTSERNVLYQDPSQLNNIIRITKNITWGKLLVLSCIVPDYLSDKHFRSQSYYLPKEVRSGTSVVKVLELKDFVSNRPVLTPDPLFEKGIASKIRLNNSKSPIPDDIRGELQRSRLFRWKYGKDLTLFKVITTGLSD